MLEFLLHIQGRLERNVKKQRVVRFPGSDSSASLILVVKDKS